MKSLFHPRKSTTGTAAVNTATTTATTATTATTNSTNNDIHLRASGSASASANGSSNGNMTNIEVRLRMACRDGYYDIVHDYCTTIKGMNFCAIDSTGWTCLHYACTFGHSRIVQYLLNYIVIETKQISIFQQLVQTKNITHGNTPLHCAIDNQHMDIVTYIVQLYNHHVIIPMMQSIHSSTNNDSSTNRSSNSSNSSSNSNSNTNDHHQHQHHHKAAAKTIYTIKNSNRQTIIDLMAAVHHCCHPTTTTTTTTTNHPSMNHTILYNMMINAAATTTSNSSNSNRNSNIHTTLHVEEEENNNTHTTDDVPFVHHNANHNTNHHNTNTNDICSSSSSNTSGAMKRLLTKEESIFVQPTTTLMMETPVTIPVVPTTAANVIDVTPMIPSPLPTVVPTSENMDVGRIATTTTTTSTTPIPSSTTDIPLLVVATSIVTGEDSESSLLSAMAMPTAMVVPTTSSSSLPATIPASTTTTTNDHRNDNDNNNNNNDTHNQQQEHQEQRPFVAIQYQPANVNNTTYNATIKNYIRPSYIDDIINERNMTTSTTTQPVGTKQATLITTSDTNKKQKDAPGESGHIPNTGSHSVNNDREVLRWNSKIITAARAGDYNAMVQLLSTLDDDRDTNHDSSSKQYNINCLCANGYTPIQWATLNKHNTLAEFMLRKQYKDDANMTIVYSMLHAKSSFGSNVLHLACSKGNLVMVQLFIEIAAIVAATTNNKNTIMECQNEAGWTALHYACNFGHFQIVQCLIENTPSPVTTMSIVDDDGETLLHRTCYHPGRLLIVQYIIEWDDANNPDTTNNRLVHRLSYKGETAYDIAMKGKQHDVADYLLSVMSTRVVVDPSPLPNDDVVTIALPDNSSSSLLPTVTRDYSSTTVYFDAYQDVDHQDVTSQLDRSVTLLLPRFCNNNNDRYDNNHDDDQQYERNSDNMSLPFDMSVTLALPFSTTTSQRPQTAAKLSFEEMRQWNELFMSVIQSGDLDTVKLCIESGCIDTEQTKKTEGGDNEYFTALHWACMNNHCEIVQYLIRDVGINAATVISNHGSNILHVACSNGNIDIVRYIIDEFLIDIESTDYDGKTALHFASQVGYINVVSYLIELGCANYTVKDKDGYTSLQIASRYGRLNLVQYIVDRYRVDAATMQASARDIDVRASYWLACQYGHFHIVKYLIHDGGITVELKNESDGMTALHFACQYGTLECVQSMYEDCNADIYALDKHGDTALDKAKTYGQTEVVTYLSQQSAHVAALGEQLRTAAKTGSLNAVIDCISNNRRVNINAGGITGKTALHYAVANGHFGIVQYLIRQCCANVNQCTVDGATPLHYACRYGHIKCVQLLCSNDCAVPIDVQLMDKQNETALDKAKHYKQDDIAEFLESFITGRPSNVSNSTVNVSDPVQIYLHPTIEETKQHIVRSNDSEPMIVNAEWITPMGVDMVDESKEVSPLNESPPHTVYRSHGESTDDGDSGMNLQNVTDVSCSIKIPAGNIPSNLDESGINKSEIDTFDNDIFNEVNDAFNDDVSHKLNNASDANISNDFNGDFDDKINQEPGDAIVDTKLNEGKLLEIMDKLQQENQLLMNLFEKNISLTTHSKHRETATTSSWLTNERRELLDQMLGEKFNDQQDQMERQAILSSTMHRDFYLLLTRKLYCMINSCENLSTGLVPSGNQKEFVRTSKSRMLRENPGQLRNSAIGMVVNTALVVAQESFPVVKVLGDPVHAMFNVIVSLKNKREQFLAVARVADFANAASILQKGNSKALQSTVEKFARLMIRARYGLPSFPFVEQEDKFGRVKQFMVNFLAHSGNTPTKEQASHAADCAIAHIMGPAEDSVLNNVLNGDDFETDLPEALAAATLNVSIDQIRNLDPFISEMSNDSDSKREFLPNNTNTMTFNAKPSSFDEEDDDVFDFEGYADDNLDSLKKSSTSSVLSTSTKSLEVVELKDKITDLERKVEGLHKLQQSFNSKTKKEEVNGAGDGLVHADFREQYKDDIKALKRQSVDCDERVNFHADEIAILKEQVQILQKQMSESTVTSSTSSTSSTSQPARETKQNQRAERGFNRKLWNRGRQSKDP